MFNEGDLFNEIFITTETEYNSFIELSKDQNPLHTDNEFAKSKGFKGKVMHGNILNSYISYFIGECLPTKNVIIHTQDIKFKNPSYLNEKLFFDAKVTGFYKSVNAVEFKFTFKNIERVVIAKGRIQIGLLLL